MADARVPGDATGIALPASPHQLRDQPERFLTQAMHAYGTLAANNAVAQVTRFEPFVGGNSGSKLLLDVACKRPDASFPTQLFAKFSRCLDDPFRDRRRHELDAEVRLAALSRNPGFPVTVARPMFADFHEASGTGLLVSERIAYGTGTIEPLHVKCMDHVLDEPLEHYRALVGTHARLAAAHKSGRLSPDVERLFPFNPQTAAADLPFTAGPGGLAERAARWCAFLERAEHLFPQNLRTSEFHARFVRDVRAFAENEAAVRQLLHADPEFIALSHWNTHIDNAWFWRDQEGTLQCGLLDWGMVRQMNVAYGLWGGLSATTLAFLDANLDGLLDHYAQTLTEHGGPKLDRAALGLHFDLSVALIGMALLMDTPAMLESRIPEIADASGLHDPAVAEDKVVQGFLLTATHFLNLWDNRDFGARLEEILR